FDLSRGSLLMVWDGMFLDATDMWESRGEPQLVAPNEFHVSSFGGYEFAFLKDENSKWVDMDDENLNFKQLGYEIDASGIPVFSNKIEGTTITNKFIPSDSERKIKRIILVEGSKEIWYKIAEGESIQAIPNNTYIINNES